MSLFGAPKATTAGSTGFSFGTPATGTSTTLGGFGFGTAAAQPATTATGTTAQPAGFQLSTFSAGTLGQPTATTATTSLGLGGFVAGGAAPSTAASQTVKTPKESQVPPELRPFVDHLRKHIKENKDLGDRIAIADMQHIQNLAEGLKTTTYGLSAASDNLRKIATKIVALKEESRADLRQGEVTQRTAETLTTVPYYGAVNIDGQTVNYLQNVAVGFEQKLELYRRQLEQLEAMLQDRRDPSIRKVPSKEEVVGLMKKMEETFNYVAASVYTVDGLTRDAKEEVMRYRRTLYGESALNPFAPESGQKPSKKSPLKRLEGPNPFGNDSVMSTSLLGVAANLGKTPGPPPPPTTGLFQTPAQGIGTGFGFGGANTTGGGLGLFNTGAQQGGVAGTTGSTSVFRPFGMATTPAPAFSGFGATSTAGNLSQTSTGASPFRFSSPFSSPSSGTLFGGTAATVGKVQAFAR